MIPVHFIPLPIIQIPGINECQNLEGVLFYIIFYGGGVGGPIPVPVSVVPLLFRVGYLGEEVVMQSDMGHKLTGIFLPPPPPL